MDMDYATSTAVAFAMNECIVSGAMDEHLPQLAYQIKQRQALYDHRKAPAKTPEMIASGHQVWVWMGGADRPHWEVRGTGVVLDA